MPPTATPRVRSECEPLRVRHAPAPARKPAQLPAGAGSHFAQLSSVGASGEASVSTTEAAALRTQMLHSASPRGMEMSLTEREPRVTGGVRARTHLQAGGPRHLVELLALLSEDSGCPCPGCLLSPILIVSPSSGRGCVRPRVCSAEARLFTGRLRTGRESKPRVISSPQTAWHSAVPQEAGPVCVGGDPRARSRQQGRREADTPRVGAPWAPEPWPGLAEAETWALVSSSDNLHLQEVLPAHFGQTSPSDLPLQRLPHQMKT